MRRTILIALVALHARDAGACSKSRTFQPLLHSSAGFLLGVATPDTVRAGPGKVTWKTEGGHFAAPRSGEIHGQVVTIERAGPRPLAATRAVFVPWDYGADCTPVPWGRTARWLRPGIAGLFRGALRDSVDWVDGMPTYDVHFVPGEPYTGTEPPTALAPSPDPLSPAELFEVLMRLPIIPGFNQVDEFDLVMPVLTWARDNAAIAKRHPAAEIVRRARYFAENGLVQRIKSPLAGTYRLTIAVDGRASGELFIRTHSVTTSAFDPADRLSNWTSRPSDDPTKFDSIPGIQLWIIASETPAFKRVPIDNEGGYLAIAVKPATDSAGIRVWEGEMTGSVWSLVFKGDLKLPAAGFPPNVRFMLGATGDATIDYSLRLADGRTVTLHGRRISLEQF